MEGPKEIAKVEKQKRFVESIVPGIRDWHLFEFDF